jgi:hypothetical protein
MMVLRHILLTSPVSGPAHDVAFAEWQVGYMHTYHRRAKVPAFLAGIAIGKFQDFLRQ